MSSELTPAPPYSHRTGPASRRDIAGWLACLLLMACLAVISLVPDEGIFRTKAIWTRGLLLLSTGCVLLSAAFSGRIVARGAAFLVVGLTPVALAAAWLAKGDLASSRLATDEVLRLGLLPVAAWTAGNAFATRSRRAAFTTLLALLALIAAGHGVAQNLAGLLGLPLDRHSRAPGSFGNPVFLGAFLVQVAPVCLAGALFATGRVRWLFALAGGLCLPALLATRTRSAWLGFAVAAVVGILILAPNRRRRLQILLLLAVAATVLLVFTLPDIQRPTQHALIWRDTLDLIVDHPWGVGPGQFPIEFVPYASRELLDVYPRASKIINDVHSEPLQILAELGWPGLVAVGAALALLAASAVRILRRVPRDDPDHPLLVGLVAALAGALAQSFVSPDLRFGVTLILMGMLTGLLLSRAEPAVLQGPRGSFVIALLGALCLWSGVSLTRSGLELKTLLETPSQSARESLEGGSRLAAADDAEQRARLTSALRGQLALDPQDWRLHLSLGALAQADGRFDDAIKSYHRVLDLQPDHPHALAGLGLCELMSRRLTQAIEHLEMARERLPRNEDVRYWLAYAALLRGDLRKALEEVEALLELSPDHIGGRHLLQQLRE